MILTPTNINPIPYYSTKEEQLHRQRWGEIVPIPAPIDRILPFQLIVASNVASCDIEVYDKYDVLLDTITPTGDDLKYYFKSSYQVAIFLSKILLENLPSGIIYLKLKFKYQSNVLNTYYSELFQTTTDDLLNENCVSIEWRNATDIPYGDYIIASGQSYTPSFRFQLFAVADIMATYDYQDVLEEKQKREFPIKYISDKIYKFGFWVTEEQMDSFRMSRTFDYIQIKQRNKTYDVNSLIITTPEWNDKGTIGWCECTFTTDTLLSVNAPAQPTRGDFNNDFNNDFN